MTTADEPPRTEHITHETIENALTRHVAVLQASPLIHGKARALLEDVAFHHLTHPFAAALAKTVESHRIDDSEDGHELRRLLTDGGVIALRGGTIQFIPVEVGDYLAACRVVRRFPGGPRTWQPWCKNYLHPQDEWPWPDSGTALYQAELWWRKARSKTRRQLDALLHQKHREHNVHFVATLLYRSQVVDDELRARTVEILLAQLTEKRSLEKWRTTLASLDLLEPRQTVTALERLAGPDSGASPLRRLDAVDELSQRDPERGKSAVHTLAATLAPKPTSAPDECLQVAQTIQQRDAELGSAAIRDLARNRNMGDWQTKAARLTGDLALWAELVGERRGVSDPERLDLLAGLAEEDQVKAVRAADRFWETATLETTLVHIAELIRKYDREAALRQAEKTAWPAQREIAGPVRLSAVHLIGELVPSRLFTELARLSREVPDEETQFKAATDIVDAGGPVTALYDLAANRVKSRDRRLRAARRIALGHPDSGGRLLVLIAEGYPATDPEMLKVLFEAHALASSPAAKALEAIARDRRRPASFRILAVGERVFDKKKTLELYVYIATTEQKSEEARTAARKVLLMNQDEGEALMAQLATTFKANPETRLGFALEAGARGKDHLYQLGLRTPSTELQLKAGSALFRIDAKKGTEVLVKTARTRWGGESRVQAACLLPAEQALDELGRIARDQDREPVRVEAGIKALEIDDKRGKEILRELARCRISASSRRRIEQLLGPAG
ncbi:hypothetical protein [Lentzea sp. NPDC060358]|uniref:hypothetical protein n=1 Tax=Lentzea sp. NPDC060358 TaxID=3347103 RepID=UPI00366A4855